MASKESLAGNFSVKPVSERILGKKGNEKASQGKRKDLVPFLSALIKSSEDCGNTYRMTRRVLVVPQEIPLFDAIFVWHYFDSNFVHIVIIYHIIIYNRPF